MYKYKQNSVCNLYWIDDDEDVDEIRSAAAKPSASSTSSSSPPSCMLLISVIGRDHFIHLPGRQWRMRRIVSLPINKEERPPDDRPMHQPTNLPLAYRSLFRVLSTFLRSHHQRWHEHQYIYIFMKEFFLFPL